LRSSRGRERRRRGGQVVRGRGCCGSGRGGRGQQARQGKARHAPGVVLVRTGGDMVGLALLRRDGGKTRQWVSCTSRGLARFRIMLGYRCSSYICASGGLSIGRHRSKSVLSNPPVFQPLCHRSRIIIQLPCCHEGIMGSLERQRMMIMSAALGCRLG
jgi:hypothetical protein